MNPSSTENIPLITVVIPVFNRIELLPRTLQSVKAQSLRPLRLVIVDNGSTADCRNLLTDWKRENETADFIIDLISESKQGAATARNAGLNTVTSEYVCFFDSDDEMRHNHLSRIADELRRCPSTDLLHFDIGILDPDGWLKIKTSDDSDLMRAHLFHGILSTARYVVRTSIAKSTGGWNEELSLWDDLEFGTRLLLQNPVISKLHGEPTAIIHAEASDESISGSTYSARHGEGEKTLSAIEHLLPSTIHKKWIDCRRAILAAHYRREGHKDLAHALLHPTLQKSGVADALKLRSVYTAVWIAGQGGAFIGSLLYRPPKVKSPKNTD